MPRQRSSFVIRSLSSLLDVYKNVYNIRMEMAKILNLISTSINLTILKVGMLGAFVSQIKGKVKRKK